MNIFFRNSVCLFVADVVVIDLVVQLEVVFHTVKFTSCFTGGKIRKILILKGSFKGHNANEIKRNQRFD